MVANPWQPSTPDPTFCRPGEPGWARQSGYQAATVCRRGHPKDSDLRAPPAAEALGFCPQCGASILARCPTCSIRIRGEYYVPDVIAVGFEYSPSKFCDGCGEPYPWATRQDRIYQLENLLDEEDIDDSTKLLVREDLERLRSAGASLDDEAQLVLWRRIKDRAPGLLTGAAWNIGQSLLSAFLRQKLGLPPG
jgi:hypothetical protein